MSRSVTAPDLRVAGQNRPIHLVHAFASFAVGGPQRRMSTLANALGRAYRHTGISLDADTANIAHLDPTLDVRFVDRPPPASIFFRLLTIRRILIGLAPDIVLTYNWGAIEWAAAMRLGRIAPHIHFEDGFGPLERVDRQLKRRILFRRIALSGDVRVVVPSRTLYRAATQTWRLPSERVQFIPNGIDSTRFLEPADPVFAERIGRRADEIVIGTLGLLRREKNIQRLIRIFGRFAARRSARLLIVGDGSEQSALVAAAEAEGLADRIVFMGPVDRPERILPYFDIFALSSDTEQMPLSVLEAMGAGLPVVSTRVGDVPDMLAPEGRAFVVDIEDEPGFADALERLADDPALRRRIGEANRRQQRAEYELRAMVDAYDRLFRTLVAAA